MHRGTPGAWEEGGKTVKNGWLDKEWTKLATHSNSIVLQGRLSVHFRRWIIQGTLWRGRIHNEEEN